MISRFGYSRLRWLVAAAGLAGLTACASGPAAPDWALQSQAALERATQAHLSGEERVALADYERARQQLSRTGRADLVARAELLRCAAQFASLQLLPQDPPGAVSTPAKATACAAFEPLRSASGPSERAYADFLAGSMEPARIGLLPPAQQPAVLAGQDAARRLAAIQAVDDPLARLVAAAAAVRDRVMPPGLAALAIDTASAQGWRRPLAAWLSLEIRRAQQAGDSVSAQALQQRLELVLQSAPSVRRQPAP